MYFWLEICAGKLAAQNLGNCFTAVQCCNRLISLLSLFGRFVVVLFSVSPHSFFLSLSKKQNNKTDFNYFSISDTPTRPRDG
jgi:hypothetical protein